MNRWKERRINEVKIKTKNCGRNVENFRRETRKYRKHSRWKIHCTVVFCKQNLPIPGVSFAIVSPPLAL